MIGNLRLTGAFPSHDLQGGGGAPFPLRSLELHGRLKKTQTAFDRYGKNYRKKSMLLTSGFTDDVTGQFKVNMFDDFSFPVSSHNETLSNGNK